MFVMCGLPPTLLGGGGTNPLQADQENGMTEQNDIKIQLLMNKCTWNGFLKQKLEVKYHSQRLSQFKSVADEA